MGRGSGGREERAPGLALINLMDSSCDCQLVLPPRSADWATHLCQSWGPEKLNPCPVDPSRPELPTGVSKCPRPGGDQFTEEPREDRARQRGSSWGE